jgi:hypothetical protein
MISKRNRPDEQATTMDCRKSIRNKRFSQPFASTASRICGGGLRQNGLGGQTSSE